MGVCKNLSLYWVAATAVGVWFLFVHSPPILSERQVWKDPLFLAHLIGVFAVYLACMHNALFTPTTFACAKTFHVWIGRIGLVMGVVGFLSGFTLTWTRIAGDDWGFSISITAGGVLQMYAQTRGYVAIKMYQAHQQELTRNTGGELFSSGVREELELARDEALKQHIFYMIVLFVMACGIPGIIRFIEAEGLDGAIWPILVALGLFNMLTIAYSRWLQSGIAAKHGEREPLIEAPA